MLCQALNIPAGLAGQWHLGRDVGRWPVGAREARRHQDHRRDDRRGRTGRHFRHRPDPCGAGPVQRRAGEPLDAMGAGHYGIFSGRRWREIVYPAVRDFILAQNQSLSQSAALPLPTPKAIAETPKATLAPVGGRKAVAKPAPVAKAKPAIAKKTASAVALEKTVQLTATQPAVLPAPLAVAPPAAPEAALTPAAQPKTQTAATPAVQPAVAEVKEGTPAANSSEKSAA